MRTEDAHFSHINVNRNIEIAGIKLIDEDTGRITTDLVSGFSAAAEVDPRLMDDIENLKLRLQRDLSDLRSTFNDLDPRVKEIEQKVTETVDLIESQQEKVYTLIASLTARINKLENVPTDPLNVRLFSVSNTQADFTITGGNASANISADINNNLTEFKYTNNYSFAVSPGVHYNVGFIQVGSPEELSLGFNAPGSSVVAILLDTVTSSSVLFKVEGPAPMEHRGKDLVVSLKTTNNTTVANKTLVHYTGAPTLSVFDNLAANTGYQLTVSETNTVLVTHEFTTTT